MRKYIGPLIALTVFGVLLLVVLLTQNGDGSNAVVATPTVSAAEKDLQIWTLGNVNQLEIKTITGTLSIKLDGGGWKEITPTAQLLDSAVISDTTSQLASLRGETLLPADKAANLATFGLDKPSLSLTVNAGKTLNFGLLNPATGNYYVKLADDPKVWAVRAVPVTTLLGWLAKPPVPAPTPTAAASPSPSTPSPTK